MDAQQFLAEFGHIANAPGGVGKLREMILALAVQGRLVAQAATDKPIAEWLSHITAQKRTLVKQKEIAKQTVFVAIPTEEYPYKLPNGWAFIHLGEITHKIGSGSTPRGGREVYVKEGVPFLRSQNIWNNGIRLDDVAYITPDEHKRMEGTAVQGNDILLNITGASLGRCALVPSDFGDANVSQHVTIIRPADPNIRDYLHLCMLSPYAQAMIWGRQVGMAREGLSKKVLEQFEIPLPPLEEQSRIVGKVDELMALCDKLEAQQQARRKLQNNLRESTLQAVASAASPHELQTTWTRFADNFGRLFDAPEDVVDLEQCLKHLALKGLLTEQERSQQVSADVTELANASVAAVLDAEMDWAIPGNWVWARCAWLGEARLGKMLDAAKNKGEFRPYLRNVNVRWGKFDLSDILSMRVEEHELPRVTVRKGDLIICEGGEPGRAAIWDKDEEFVIQKALHRFRCNTAVLPEYLLFCLEHDFFSGRLARYYTGATIKHLTGRALSEYPIPLPPVEEQERILAAAKKLASCTANLKGKLGAGIRCAEALAEASIASLTGITLEQEKEVPVKAPQTELIVPLRLGTAPDIKVQAPLATILARHHGEMSAKNLWQRFGGEIDAFYAQLKTEVAHGWILEPAPAEVREKPADMVSA